jgi:ferredoxin
LSQAQSVLQAMGYPGQALALIRAEVCADLPQAPMPERLPVTFGGSNHKRETLFRALDHLHAEAPDPQSEIPLPQGAPFGEIHVDPKACTLCMACVAVCPAKALATPGDRPRLDFIELNCVQCGLCAQACPEHAITLRARLITDAAARSNRRTLNEEEPFECIRCGKPFATRSMIERMTARLAEHWMFKDEASRRRLQMCEDCRVIDMFSDEASGAGNGKP